jgi:hypothetical protein
MTRYHWRIVLLVFGLTSCGARPLTVPLYPNAQHTTIDPQAREPYTWPHHLTTFDTVDSPETVRAWYQDTLQRMGWESTPRNPDHPDWLAFTDPQSGCTPISLAISTAPDEDGGTRVAVHYVVGVCDPN